MFCFRDRRRRSGFTLIEVLLVMVILVVLASFVVVATGPIQRKVKVNQAKTQIGMLKTALKSYEVDLGSPPTTAQGLNALLTMPADLMNPAKWQGTYLESEIPLDPWDNYYQYASPGTRNPDTFDIWTVSPDGEEIGNWTAETVK